MHLCLREWVALRQQRSSVTVLQHKKQADHSSNKVNFGQMVTWTTAGTSVLLLLLLSTHRRADHDDVVVLEILDPVYTRCRATRLGCENGSQHIQPHKVVSRPFGVLTLIELFLCVVLLQRHYRFAFGLRRSTSKENALPTLSRTLAVDTAKYVFRRRFCVRCP